MYFEDQPRPELVFEAELIQFNPLIEAVDKLHQNLNLAGVEMTIIADGKSATIGKRKEKEHDA